MGRSAAFTWGTCACGGTFEHQMIVVTMTVGGAKVVLQDVPQGRCTRCGSRVYKAEALARIEDTMKDEPRDRAVCEAHG